MQIHEPIYRNYLFCIDENGEAFTLYDCYIMPLQIPVKQMKIIWNKCLLGYHLVQTGIKKMIILFANRFFPKG